MVVDNRRLGIWGMTWPEKMAKALYVNLKDKQFQKPLSWTRILPGIDLNTALVNKMEYYRLAGLKEGLKGQALALYIQRNTGVKKIESVNFCIF